jgi:hypothetical protein
VGACIRTRSYDSWSCLTVGANEAVTESVATYCIPRTRVPTRRLTVLGLNVLATFQFIWFYLSRVPSCLDLPSYEAWRERSPFQYRVLMVYPLQWAHHNAALVRLAARLSLLTGWFPTPIHPEGILQAAIDVLCIGTAGIVARRIYKAASPTGALVAIVYPLTLAMAAATYAMLTTPHLRFVYDLPSLAFFSLGLYLIYFRHHIFWFVVLFLVATLNRETSLFLLVIFAIDWSVTTKGKIDWRRVLTARYFLMLVSLSAYWVAWHFWVVHHFAANPVVDARNRLRLNLGVILSPLSWPQCLALGCFLVPLLLLNRSRVQNDRLRAWYWVLPLWLIFMMRYALISEIRVFGELIPFFSCLATLIFEQQLIEFWRVGQRSL